jgi:hypothetical protein
MDATLNLYIDGKKMKGSWKKESIDKPAKFYDEKGELMKLKAGNTWIQVVSNTEVK